MIFKGSLCKEDLQRLIDNTDWGNAASDGKHYKNFDGTTLIKPDDKGFDVILYWRQPQELWGKVEQDVFLRFRTLHVYRSYMEQINHYKSKSKHLNSNNNIGNKIDNIYG